MPSTATESVSFSRERAELEAVLHSQVFARAPGLAHFLSYLCEKLFAGDSSQIKEYSIALDVFGRSASFNQDTDSIVRVQANRLRKQLAEYYKFEGLEHRLRITIPVGQYIPKFEAATQKEPHTESELATECKPSFNESSKATPTFGKIARWGSIPVWFLFIAIATYMIHKLDSRTISNPEPPPLPGVVQETVGLPVGDELRILAGSSHSYVDRSGKLWTADRYFTAGQSIRSPVQHIWRTQDPAIYRGSRQGDFNYDIPLKQGTYELRLHFAEMFYGPENIGGGGEGSRIISVTSNDKPLLTEFDVTADAGGGRTADVKMFTDISPGQDGFVHLGFHSSGGGKSMVSAIELLPGIRSRMRPIRIVARSTPYYSNNSQWWSSDMYFKGGQLAENEEPVNGTDDPELYETERWGNFSYAIPVPPGKYTVTLYFVARSPQIAGYSGALSPQNTSAEQAFNVFCNGTAILSNLNLRKEEEENRPFIRKISGLAPNAQGKLLLEFVPIKQYATISAIEVVQQ